MPANLVMTLIMTSQAHQLLHPIISVFDTRPTTVSSNTQTVFTITATVTSNMATYHKELDKFEPGHDQ